MLRPGKSFHFSFILLLWYVYIRDCIISYIFTAKIIANQFVAIIDKNILSFV